MPTKSATDATRLLLEVRSRPASGRAVDRLFEVLYEELRRQAHALMRGERRSHTLTPTALVHEAFLRLIDQKRVEGPDRAHFRFLATRAMRQILIEHARARDTKKRGGGWRRITIDTGALSSTRSEFDVVVLNDALEALARRDQRAATVTELRIFGGMTHAEIARVLGVSRRTVDGDWSVARKWLSREMEG